MNEHVLITGASGFLGYHIVSAAVGQGLKVFAGIRNNSDIKHLAALPLKYLHLNYDQVETLTRQLEDNQIKYIIHAAGITKALKQAAYNKINASNTLNLALAAENVKSSFGKMVFISSLAAVGPLAHQAEEITEDTTPKPVTAYGKSKLLAENHLAGVSIPTIILRPTAVYGARDKDIFILIKTVNRGIDPYIGKFLQQLSFVHSKDVADVAVGSLFINDASGVYNITDGNRYNRYEFSDIVKKILNKNVFRFHIPLPLVRSLAFFLETTGNWLKKPSVITREKLLELAAKNWVCNIEKAKRELQFQPKYNLQTGLEDSIDWYVKNKWI